MPLKPNQLAFHMFKRTTDESVGMNVNGSVTPALFRVTGGSSGPIEVVRINFTLLDATIRYDYFGGIAALTNGLTIKLHDEDDNVLLDFMDGQTIKANYHFGLLAGVDSAVSAGAGPDYLPIRWTIEKAGGPVILEEGHYIEIAVNDDITGLTVFLAMLQGIQR